MLDLLHGKVIDFHGSILGFNDFHQFTLSIVEEKSPYAYLRSKQDDNIGFLVVSPFVFYPDYTFEIEEKDKELLELTSHEEVAVLSIVTIKQPFEQSTINLLAPLLVNVSTGRARQIVLPPKFNYGVKEPLLREVQSESGE